MPNWCWNELTVTGPTLAVRALLAQVDNPDAGTALSLEQILPTPPELRERAADINPIDAIGALLGRAQAGADEDWYSWRLRHHGTKSEVTAEVAVTDGPESGQLTAVFTFNSAWTPPQAAITTLARQYPMCALALAYDEPANNFAGADRWENGTLVNSESGPSELAAPSVDDCDAAADDTTEDALL